MKFYSHQWEVSQTPALSDGDTSDLCTQQTKMHEALVTDLRTDLTVKTYSKKCMKSNKNL
jgi:hypothetical protein